MSAFTINAKKKKIPWLGINAPITKGRPVANGWVMARKGFNSFLAHTFKDEIRTSFYEQMKKCYLAPRKFQDKMCSPSYLPYIIFILFVNIM